MNNGGTPNGQNEEFILTDMRVQTRTGLMAQQILFYTFDLL